MAREQFMTFKYMAAAAVIAAGFVSGCSNRASPDFNNMSRQDQVNAMKADPSKMSASERAKIDAAMAKAQQSRPAAAPQAPK